MPVHINRTASVWAGDDLVLRISLGLESLADLEVDGQNFMDRLCDAIATGV